MTPVCRYEESGIVFRRFTKIAYSVYKFVLKLKITSLCLEDFETQ